MNRTDYKKASRNRKPNLTDEYRGTLELKKDAASDYDLVGQMPKKAPAEIFFKGTAKVKKEI